MGMKKKAVVGDQSFNFGDSVLAYDSSTLP
jgi:hypothetical protein